MAFSGPGALTLIGTLGLFYAPEFARIAYGEVRAARRREFVEAMRALGAGPWRLMGWTILPNIAAPLFVQFALVVAAAIVVESGLSFLGLGVVPPTPSWGLMIRGARTNLQIDPEGLLWPCLALVATIFTVNSLCDAVRDVLDPRTGRGGSVRRSWASSARRNALAIASEAQLEVRDLTTQFATPAGTLTAVTGVSLSVKPGETVALVGESGSGKSVTSLSVMGLLPQVAARIAGGDILIRRRVGGLFDMAASSRKARRAVQGYDAAMVFQEPMTSLNPVYRVGNQIVEAILSHRRMSRQEARAIALDMLTKVGIVEPARRLDQYPHEMSGGMRQRVVIAMALACDPGLLVADEPTTALDVTIQAEILALFKRLQAERQGSMGILIVTHNMAVVADVADSVVVMYAGRVVERASMRDLFVRPRHPYTRRLMRCIPRPEVALAADGKRPRLETIPGSVPSLAAMPAGCKFADRCDMVIAACREAEPELYTAGPGQESRCIRWMDL